MSDCTHCKDGYRLVLNSATDEKHRVRCFCQEDIPFPVVLQPENAGCAIAAVATIARLPYEDVRLLIHMDRDFTKEGTYESEVLSLLDRLGFAYQVRHKVDPRLSAARVPWPPEPWAPVHGAMVRNLPNSGYHFVVMLNDGRVLDPWWGVVQGLHRYPEVSSVIGCYRVSVPSIRVK